MAGTEDRSCCCNRPAAPVRGSYYDKSLFDSQESKINRSEEDVEVVAIKESAISPPPCSEAEHV